MHLEPTDRKILESLQKNGRLTNSDLAEMVGLSPSQCSRRRSELEKSGIIHSYHARLNRDAIGMGLTSLVSITLSHHDENNAERLRNLLKSIPNVQSAYALTGEMDYMIVVVTRDLKELSEFINKTLLPHKAVQNVKTSIALEVLKDTSTFPLD